MIWSRRLVSTRTVVSAGGAAGLAGALLGAAAGLAALEVYLIKTLGKLSHFLKILGGP